MANAFMLSGRYVRRRFSGIVKSCNNGKLVREKGNATGKNIEGCFGRTQYLALLMNYKKKKKKAPEDT
jgi:hypothetical protein